MFGFIPDKRDDRDYPLCAHPLMAAAASTELPDSVDLRPGMPPVYNQGETNSCVAHAICAMCQYIQRDERRHVIPSRLFNYYYARKIGGLLPNDAGSQPRDAIKAVVDYGLPPEEVWPFDPARQAVEPSNHAKIDALSNQALQYHKVATASLYDMKMCLKMLGPIAVGLVLTESFMSIPVSRTGMVPIPKKGEREIGGHEMLLVGYYNGPDCFVVRNSWGEKWGSSGYCYVPYHMIVHSLYDGWTITQMEDQETPTP